jgi:[ribosomal protein S5]-alanine N-acetyltransferase
MTTEARHIFLESSRIYLRALEERDLDGPWFQWLNDPEVCRYNSHATFPNTATEMRDFFESTRRSRDAVVLAMVWKETDEHIGNLSLQRINWIDRTADLAILLGDRRFWKTGVSTEACRLLVEYGFIRLGLERIQCGTTDDNVGMQKLALRVGMSQEGVRRQAVYKNGKRRDLFEYGILRDEFLARRKGTAAE